LKITIPDFKIDVFDQYIYGINNAIEVYNESLTGIINLKEEVRENELFFVLRLFSPLLIVVGLAVRFLKTAGEIRLETRSESKINQTNEDQ
jgi:hypothetical protein